MHRVMGGMTLIRVVPVSGWNIVLVGAQLWYVRLDSYSVYEGMGLRVQMVELDIHFCEYEAVTYSDLGY